MLKHYDHDCDGCIFLGSIEDQGKDIDLYWCKSKTSSALDSLIARFSSKGSDYAAYHPPDCYAEPEESAKMLSRHKEYREIMSAGIKKGVYNGAYAYLFKDVGGIQ